MTGMTVARFGRVLKNNFKKAPDLYVISGLITCGSTLCVGMLARTVLFNKEIEVRPRTSYSVRQDEYAADSTSYDKHKFFKGTGLKPAAIFWKPDEHFENSRTTL
eukprot:TRINITY_DN24051_c0_g1_i1.p1 TRINITY_DN24051_c0_g1~~TRINITY_DN24051_c0_g1_i1.p1  ORF type:complete len:105 (-),score=32.34 TRINITY_DN24051_c0_g1_i1:198-512(-)